ncbi:MAG TPA: S-adenosylmethionine decarboxylase [Polyangiaceae bacterium]|jgi:S-adenosylmethionine/arginine decarboxylase-like enzyme|nr:S-adenosylmethionine decarboxylase [Polyangiaceae bacterium]
MKAAPADRSTTVAWSLATADLVSVPSAALDDADWLVGELERTLSHSLGALTWRTHRFEPSGLSVVGTGPLGRVIVHTWPEHGALTVDLYGDARSVEAALGESVAGLMQSERAAG